jgi:hypothetical protein
MLRRVPLYYLFQQPERLLMVPRLPVGFDLETLNRAARVLAEINKETTLPLHRVRAELGDDYLTLEGLFEECGDDQVTLSPFGLLFSADLEAAAGTQVYLSPAARTSLDRAEGIAKSQFEFMLDRCRNPLWRASKDHPYEGTDLDVYKPGSTSQRMAAWVAADGVYVAELYADHDTYVTHLSGRWRKDYPLDRFTPWVGEPDSVTSVEEAGDRLMRTTAQVAANANQRVASAERSTNEALSLAESYEQKVRAAEEQLAQAQGREADARARYEHVEGERNRFETTIATFAQASLFRRLRAAWSGRLSV